MKTFVHVLFIAACLVACARGFPGLRYDESDEDSFDDPSGFGFVMPDFFNTFNKLRQHLLNYFWDMPDMSNIPEGANTTSTVKIINGHVVTINETTYSSGDDMSGTAFRIRIIDVKPLNDTDAIAGGNAGPNAGPTTVNPETPESRETVEDFNNEISKSTDTLTA